jgi:hypothetical protein
MQNISIRNSVFIMLFLITGAVFSQDLGSETVEVVKPYTPSVNDAFKVRENPSITDSINLEKKQVQYSIFSVPVASTFAPAKGRATNVERERPVKIYDNYATFGAGSYTSLLAEFYSNLEVNRTDNFGIFFAHNSSQGGIEEVNFDDKYYDTELNLNYTSRKRNMSWNTDFGAEHRLFNWYGVPEAYRAEAPSDPQQNYFSVYVGGELNFDDSFFDSAEAKYRFTGDSYSTAEHHLNVKPELEIPIGGELFHTNLILDYVGGSFDRNFLTQEGINYGFLNVGLGSSLVVLRDDLTLNLGAAVYYSQDIENSDSGVYLYPQVTASYRLAGEYLVAYAGLEGELRQNTYYQFAQQNPFISPTLEMQPTDQQYDLYFGGKGKLTNSVGYNVRARYKTEDYKPLFRSNTIDVNGDFAEDYHYGNSFEVVYDRVNTISGYGELNVEVNRNVTLGLNGEYFIYDTDDEGEAWNLPDFKVSLLGDFQITEKWYAGTNLFIVGERKDYFSTTSTELTSNSRVVSLDSYVDLNANLGYRFNEQLSAFVRGNNLLGNNYERWMDFPVLGLQVMGGVTYKFDF